MRGAQLVGRRKAVQPQPVAALVGVLDAVKEGHIRGLGAIGKVCVVLEVAQVDDFYQRLSASEAATIQAVAAALNLLAVLVVLLLRTVLEKGLEDRGGYGNTTVTRTRR